MSLTIVIIASNCTNCTESDLFHLKNGVDIAVPSEQINKLVFVQFPHHTWGFRIDHCPALRLFI